MILPFALVIALAIPVCYSLTLFVNLLAGYTINRVTMFALILVVLTHLLWARGKETRLSTRLGLARRTADPHDRTRWCRA